MAKRGAKTKYNKELQDKLCEYLAAGNYIETACALVGIATETFYAWKGAKNEFSDAVQKARASAEAVSVMRIRKAGNEGEWQADAWFLERSYPDRWGRVRHEVAGPNGEPFKVYLNVDVEKV